MRWLPLGLLIALACSACTEEDPLDPELLQRIARRSGDGTGNALSGVYPMPATTPSRCECSAFETSALSALLGTNAPPEATCENLAAWTFLKQFRFAVEQYDGFMIAVDEVPGGILVYSGTNLTLTGALDESERASLASVVSFLGDQVQLRVRAELTFDTSDGEPTTASGTLRSRILTQVPGSQVDCRIDFDLEGVAQVPDPNP